MTLPDYGISTELALFALAVSALCAAALIKLWYVNRRDARRRAAVQRELARHDTSGAKVLVHRSLTSKDRDERVFNAINTVRKGRPS